MNPSPALVRLRTRRARPLRVLLAQLPIPELVYRRVRANAPIAAGYLKATAEAWAAANGRAGEVEIEILPRELADRAGDAALARAIADRKPDVLGLSLFLWNASRSIAVAGEAKRRLGGELCVVAGGPEVTPDNPWVVEDSAVDLGVVGEGEATFQELIAWTLGDGEADPSKIPGLVVPVSSGGRLPVRSLAKGPARGPIDLGRVRSPYLGGAVPPSFERSLGLETLRGCPFQCSFCYYYKQFSRVTSFPGRWLEDHFAHARAHSMEEVVFLDPTLNARPGFAAFLERVVALNPDRALSLHGELVAEMIDERTADLLAKAGFQGVECGLQSANPVALEAVNRRGDLVKFERAVRLMSERGIEVKTDLIIGLPHDDEASIGASMDWVKERRLDAAVQVFHLQLLPGTELRSHEAEHGYARLGRPPYYATRSRWLDEGAIRRLAARAEATFGVEFDPPARPLLGAPLARDARALDRDGLERSGACASHARVDLATLNGGARELGAWLGERAANALTLELSGLGPATDLAPARAFLDALSRATPSTTLDLVVRAAPGTSLDALADLKGAAAPFARYLDSWYRFVAPEGSCPSVRVTARVEQDADPAWVDTLAAAVPVVQDLKGAAGLEALHEGAFAAVHAEPGDGGVLAALEARFADDREAVYLEGDPSLARAWAEASGERLDFAPPVVALDLGAPVAAPRG